MGGGAVGQRGDLLLRARLPQPVQQLGHGARVVEGDVGGGITAQQRGDLLLRARLPQAVQQLGHGARVVEGDVGGGPAHGADVSAEAVAEGRRGRKQRGGCRWAAAFLWSWAASRYRPRAWAASPSAAWSPGKAWSAAAAQKPAGGIWLVPVAPAVLVEVVREPVQRPARDAGPAASPLLIAVPGAGPGRRDLAGRGRMRVSGPRTPLQGTAV